MFSSIRVRLTLWYVLIFGLLLIGFSVFTYALLSRNLYNQMDDSLSKAAKSMASEFVGETEENGGNTKLGAEETLRELSLPGLYTSFYAGDQLLASNYPQDLSPALTSELFQATGGDRPAFHTTDGFGEEGARVVALPIKQEGAKYFVVIAEPLHDVIEQLEATRRIYYMALPTALFIAGFGGFLLARKSLAPVVIMSDQARAIGASNLHERLKVRNKSDELGLLAEVFNELLSRLEQSFEKMKGFMADASHELRTPLSIIRGEAEVALSQDRDAHEYRESLAIIQDETRRLSRIVDDMLALARADAGQRPMVREEFYLNDLVEECCKAAQILALRKGVALVSDSGQDAPFQGDEDMLRRLILNLLDNAVKYTPTGGSIVVRLESGKRQAKIIVSDTGIGIPVDAASHVFERFYRVSKARSRAEGGSGLGLSIARWVAESHNGTIDLDSQPGRGSTFTVTLPL